jgi:hypothetical protein
MGSAGRSRERRLSLRAKGRPWGWASFYRVTRAVRSSAPRPDDADFIRDACSLSYWSMLALEPVQGAGFRRDLQGLTAARPSSTKARDPASRPRPRSGSSSGRSGSCTGLTISRPPRCGSLRGGVRPPTREMTTFIDEQRVTFGVEPFCQTLEIARSSQDATQSRPPWSVLPVMLTAQTVRRTTRSQRTGRRSPPRRGASG